MVKFPISTRNRALMTPSSARPPADPRLRPLPQLIFMSRWLQLPLYLDSSGRHQALQGVLT